MCTLVQNLPKVFIGWRSGDCEGHSLMIHISFIHIKPFIGGILFLLNGKFNEWTLKYGYNWETFAFLCLTIQSLHACVYVSWNKKINRLASFWELRNRKGGKNEKWCVLARSKCWIAVSTKSIVFWRTFWIDEGHVKPCLDRLSVMLYTLSWAD